jgi:SNF2 family DNA or RNA helicase
MIFAPGSSGTLVPTLSLGEGHEEQERAVAAALRRLVVEEHRGVVLADEVGFGKTYEALALVSQLCAYARKRRKTFERALVLCKPSLVRKWEEETSATRPDRGFPRYLPQGHPARAFFFDHEIHCIDSRATARELRRAGVRGQALKGRHQVRPGLYIVNEKLLQEEKRGGSPLLRQIWRTRWDAIIVDEAHHYARGNRPARLFAPDGNLRNYDQVSLEFDRIIALTATPFELTPNELVNLFALVRAKPDLLDTIEQGLAKFVRALDQFFGLRQRTPSDPLRQQQVALLNHLRDDDALGGDGAGAGLQSLLRQLLIRNTKRQNERRYFLVERGESRFESREFRKLDDDLPQRVRRSLLIPFEGEHTLFYLELRELIADDLERRREGDKSRTFIPMELSQGLSSYRQIVGSKLLENDRLENASRLRALVGRWNRDGKLHPKVAALREIIRDIAGTEMRKIATTSDVWFSKVLVFNKLIRGTAPQLTDVLSKMLDSEFETFLASLLSSVGIVRDALAAKVRSAVDQCLAEGDRSLRLDPAFAPWRTVPNEFEHEDFQRHRGRPLLNVFREPLRRRAVQPLALIDLMRKGQCDDAGITAWVEREITGRVVKNVRAVIDRFLDDSPDHDEPRESLLERAERDLLVELEESKSVQVVGRFDGDNARDREAHRRNFNRRHNPFVLLVGQVGEEGIDLQEQCRYIIHYDLEWNPARMEQREGRVDRVGWGRAAERYIDVKFLLLKGTYEERIFHTVMQRDQWFQVLMGSKKRALGELPENGEEEIEQDRIASEEVAGTITEAEKARVMLDLRPR